ncbi:MAG: hypothetical protein DHS20C21_24440 [Gemmatimonadota bacterium]|nr:MAG: hypothetical protein DHS20C21_24440 [Gemmatimonadota bacterium]
MIRAPEPEIYDLWTDPGELTNLYEDASALAATAPLWALLEESQRRERVALPTSVDESTEQLLASLGYVSMSPEVDGGDGALPDPKHRIELLRHVSIAKGSLAAGRLVEASQAANAALAVDPEHKETHIVLGQLEARAGHAARALEQFRHCLELPPAVSNATVYFEMGMVALQSGNAQDAEKYFGRSTRENPLNANAFFQWGQAAYALHRLADAREHWRTVVRLDPDHVAARTRLREVKSQSGANP